MSARLSRRLSVAAVASASLAGLAIAPSSASASNPGVPGSSPLTVDDGNGNYQAVGGASTPEAAAPATGIAWSPDGSSYAFARGSDIWIAHADGTGLRKVALDAGGDNAHPVWADHGSIIIYTGFDTATSSAELRATYANGDAVDSGGNPASWPLPKTAAAGFGDSWADWGADVTVFERQALGATPPPPGIFVRSAAGSYVPFEVAHVGHTPTVSPDGKLVAYVAPDSAGVNQIWTVPTALPSGTLATPIQQTFGKQSTTQILYSAQHPAFAPDGKSIAFVETTQATASTQAVSSLRTIALNTSPTATANAETTQPTSISVNGRSTAAYRTEFPKDEFRLAGADRLATAVAVSGANWRNNGDNADLVRGQADVAVLSRSDLFADALAGSALAAQKNGPLLLTPTAGLAPGVRDELKRTLAPGSTVYLLGGGAALSPNVELQVRALGFVVQRVSGADRYATAVAIADQVAPNPSEIMLATGANFPDALSAGAAAGAHPGTVVVLTQDKAMPAATMAYLRRFNSNFDVNSPVHLAAVGGQALAALDSTGAGFWRLPLAGADRYQTSYLVARDFFPELHTVGVATGTAWPDALSGGAFIGNNFGPLLLMDPAVGLSPTDAQFLDDNRGSLYAGFVFGGPAAVPSWADQQLRNDIGGPLGFSTAVGAAHVAAHSAGGPRGAGSPAGSAGPQADALKPEPPAR